MKKGIIFLSTLAVISVSVIAQNKSTHKPVSNAASASVANGKKVYLKYCLSCHQADGGGVQNMNPPLTNTQYVIGDKTALVKIVLGGFNKGVQINGQTYNNAMPSFSYLKDQDVADVLTYIRSHFTNKASAVKTSDVVQIRNLK